MKISLVSRPGLLSTTLVSNAKHNTHTMTHNKKTIANIIRIMAEVDVAITNANEDRFENGYHIQSELSKLSQLYHREPIAIYVVTILPHNRDILTACAGTSFRLGAKSDEIVATIHEAIKEAVSKLRDVKAA